jgi:hypothetical protein
MGIADDDRIGPVADLLEDILGEGGLGDWVIWLPDPGKPECQFTTYDVFNYYLKTLEGEDEGEEVVETTMSLLARMFPGFRGFRNTPRVQSPVVVCRIYDESEADDVPGITDAERRIRERLGLPTGEEVSAEEVAGMRRAEAEEELAAEEGPAADTGDASDAVPESAPEAEAEPAGDADA